MITVTVTLTESEAAVVQACITYQREMFIDDAMDDPTVDRADEVELLGRLIAKFRV